MVCHLFSWTAELHEGYHYDPLLPDPLVVDLVAMGGAGGDSGAASSKSHRVLRREKAMGGDEDLAALEALGRRAAVSAGVWETLAPGQEKSTLAARRAAPLRRALRGGTPLSVRILVWPRWRQVGQQRVGVVGLWRSCAVAF